MNAAQEVGFMLAHFFSYVDSALARGLPIAAVVSKREWHASTDLDLFEEVAKYRAGRRLFARLMKERYRCDDPEVLGLRISTWTTGDHLTAQQPLNNLARISMSVLAAFLGGAEHIWAPAYDEALALPTSESTRIANQVKYVIHHECGLENTVDPLAGSYYVERLTCAIEEESIGWLREIERRGGVAAAVDQGFYQREALRGLHRYQMEIETGERKKVGINLFPASGELPLNLFQADPEDEKRQIQRFLELKARRDGKLVQQRLNELADTAARKAADKRVNTVPAMLAAVKAYAAVGEIHGVLRQAFGTFKPPVAV